ncbi:MAG: GTP cyclohydrolase I FolE [Dehalococcoidia bacterium]|nr:GTP cyclohydrolase I FolE [Dehalococcoidia bacterium]
MIEEQPVMAPDGLRMAPAQLEFEDGPVLNAEFKNLVAGAISTILEAVGEDPTRSGIADTPSRVARMYDELLSGYKTDPVELLNNALFDVEYDEMVVVKDIDFYSMCEHHMLPFYGHASVGYIPEDKVIGLSKIPRIVDMFARRLQVQERMTQQIATFLEELIRPRGVAVVVEASHLCAAMRGVKKQRTRMLTSAMLGAFRDNPSTRAEFMMHIRAGSDPKM